LFVSWFNNCFIISVVAFGIFRFMSFYSKSTWRKDIVIAIVVGIVFSSFLLIYQSNNLKIPLVSAFQELN